MVRTRDPKRREKFLNAALQLFVSKGVQNTSTSDIAKEAGSAAGTLFLYFPTKQDLIHELVLKISQEQSEAINNLLDPALNARDTFAAIWRGSIHWFMDHMDAYRYVQQVRDSGMIRDDIARESGKFLAYYYAAVEKGLAEAAIRPYPAELIGGVLYQHVVAVMNLIRTQPDPAMREQYIEQGFEIFWNGIKNS